MNLEELTLRTNTFLLVAILCPIAAWAADTAFDIKPGLWDIANTMQMSGMPPIPNLDKMPPEQRARIEAAMKNMGGTHTNTVKSCITKDTIEKAIARANNGKNNTCAPKLVNMSASKVEMHIDCTQENGDSKSTGDMTIERRDSEHFTGSGAVKSTSSNGRNMDMKWSMTGTFISSDCGNVKPAGQ